MLGISVDCEIYKAKATAEMVSEFISDMLISIVPATTIHCYHMNKCFSVTWGC
jgi:hypothetical protein